VGDVWARRSSEVAQNVAVLLYPAWDVTDETARRTDEWLASADHPPSLRRLVVEGRDRLVRALAARAKDAAAS
jgi:aminopeptidase N